MAQNDIDDVLRQQYTSWTLIAGPNLGGFRSNLENTDNAPDRITPALGADIGAAISYHIASNWQLRLAVLASLERSRIQKDDQSATLSSIGGDIVLQAGYTIPLDDIRLLVLCGPYTRFIVADNSNNHLIANPFRRDVADNPRTGNPLFALGDLGAGAALTLAVQFRTNWQIGIDTRWGITDLLNADSHSLYVKPYKLALFAAKEF